MKIIALMIIFIMLVIRIKNTPRSLSKKLWLKRQLELIDKMKNKQYKDENEKKMIQSVSIIGALLIEFFYIIFYAILGTTLGATNPGGTFMIVTSAIQAFLTLYAVRHMFTYKFFSLNIEDYKFHRWENLINVIMDYIYYPTAIYMLLV